MGELPATVGSCLELGAGQGAFTRFIRQRLPNAKIVGLDIGDKTNTYTTQMIRGSAEHLPFERSSFQAVACRLTLVYVQDLESAVAEVARVLQPGGVFVAQELLIDRARPGSNVEPQLPSFVTLTNWMSELWSRTTTERVPLRLPGLLGQSGFSRIRFASRPAMMLETGETWVQSRVSQLDDTRGSLVANGIATYPEIDALRELLLNEYGSAQNVAGIGLTTVGVHAQRD